MRVTITAHASQRCLERFGKPTKDILTDDIYSCVEFFNGDCIILKNKVKFVFKEYKLITIIKRYAYLENREYRRNKSPLVVLKNNT